jgi:biotin carboxyl carrier protein
MAKTLTLRSAGRDYRVTIDEGTIAVDGVAVAPTNAAWSAADGDTRWVFVDGELFEFQVQHEGRRKAAAQHGSLSAPMPATVIRVNVAPGAPVRRGETLIVLEAMKMELPVRAPADGTVRAVHCREGQLVQPGIALVELDS